MEGYTRKDHDIGGCPKLLDLIPKQREWLLKMKEESSEEKKLELRLGPPGGDDDHHHSPLSFSGSKRGFIDTVINGSSPPSQAQNQAHKFSWCSSSGLEQQQTKASFLKLHQSNSHKESSQHCCNNKGTVDFQKSAAEKKAFSQSENTAVPNSTAQKRTAPAPVVGWPPIRSFRKNLSSTSSLKSSPESSNKAAAASKEKPVESCQKGLFVKINMDGVPIGRKVDLKAYNGYEKLSSVVDELFRGLLSAQENTYVDGIKSKGEGEKVITGLLDGSGEYTLVYEDNEGDRMLVGDVPWHMFVNTVKRLRVLKSSEISTLCRGRKQGKLSLDNASLK